MQHCKVNVYYMATIYSFTLVFHSKHNQCYCSNGSHASYLTHSARLSLSSCRSWVWYTWTVISVWIRRLKMTVRCPASRTAPGAARNSGSSATSHCLRYSEVAHGRTDGQTLTPKLMERAWEKGLLSSQSWWSAFKWSKRTEPHMYMNLPITPPCRGKKRTMERKTRGERNLSLMP